MFRRIILFLLVLSMLLVLPAMASAEESDKAKSDAFAAEDSKSINADTISRINEIVARNNIDSEGEFIRVYSVSLTLAFNENDNVDDVLAGRRLLEIYYAIKDSNNEYHFYSEQGVRKDIIYFNYQSLELCKSGDIPSMIADDVIVYNTYYLSGESCHVGTAIYYKTNKGDYVYFDPPTGGEYLFPVDAFCAYQEAVLEQMAAIGEGDVGIALNTVWDLSPYDFKSPLFNLNAEIPDNKNTDKENSGNLVGVDETSHPVGVEPAVNEGESDYMWIIVLGACLLIAGMAGGIMWRRKKQTN